MILVLINIFGCANKSKTEKSGDQKKKIKVYLDVKDKYSQSIFKLILDEYKKENKDIEIDISSPLESQKIDDDIVKGGAADLILTSRNKMIDLSKKGLLADLSTFYTKNKISDKFYNIISTYGRFGDRYYGVGLMPYSLEILYSPQGLAKLGLTPPKNIVELVPVLKKISESNIKIPVVLPEDVDIYNAMASVLYSNMSDINKLEKAYDTDKQTYKEIGDVQALFAEINRLSKLGTFNKDTFELGSENSVNGLISGDIPLIGCISYFSKNIKDTPVGLIERYDVSATKENIPVIVNALLCTPANTKNEESVTSLMEYIFSEKTQKKLATEGFVTANKEANGNLVGSNKIIDEHLSQANSNSILYIYNFPEKFKSKFEGRISKIMSGKYTGNEWNEILDELYK